MDEVFEDLYIGGIEDTADPDLVEEEKVDRVISLTHEDPRTSFSDRVQVSDFAMKDGPQNDEEVFHAAVNEVVQALESGETVFVHCSKGFSRSPSVAATAAAIYNDIGMDQSFIQIQRHRQEVNPHDDLVSQAFEAYYELTDQER